MRDVRVLSESVRINCERSAAELAAERWWHLWAKVAVTAMATVSVLLVLDRLF